MAGLHERKGGQIRRWMALRAIASQCVATRFLSSKPNDARTNAPEQIEPNRFANFAQRGTQRRKAGSRIASIKGSSEAPAISSVSTADAGMRASASVLSSIPLLLATRPPAEESTTMR